MKLTKEQLRAIHAKNYTNSRRLMSRNNFIDKGINKIPEQKLIPLKSNTKEIIKKVSNTTINPLENNIGINAIGQISSPFLSSIFGFPISSSVTTATLHSLYDSYKTYNQTERIDDALFEGMKSWMNNYMKIRSHTYLQKNLSEKTDDGLFSDVIHGVSLVSSLIPIFDEI